MMSNQADDTKKSEEKERRDQEKKYLKAFTITTSSYFFLLPFSLSPLSLSLLDLLATTIAIEYKSGIVLRTRQKKLKRLIRKTRLFLIVNVVIQIHIIIAPHLHHTGQQLDKIPHRKKFISLQTNPMDFISQVNVCRVPWKFLFRICTNILVTKQVVNSLNIFVNNHYVIIFLLNLSCEATYSAEVDAAADSDGHVTHQVNLCRQPCSVTIHYENERQSMQTDNAYETSFNQTTTRASDTQALACPLPSIIKGTFQLQIPDDLPPSLMSNRLPSVIYTLELNLSSSRYRYQIPIILSSRGYIPHVTTDIESNNNAVNSHDIQLQAYLAKQFYRPGEQISVRVNYTNPHQRSIRSITVTLLQFYRIHNDQYSSQLDGKGWTFDTSQMSSQREWHGEALLQLPYPPLQASFSNQFIGTTQQIACEVDYRLVIELNEKKGDDIYLTLPSINVTYQK